MAEILQLQPHESIYDPTCGSGGMLIKSLTYLKDKGEEWRDVKVFGQEINAGTSAIARMNLYLHGIHDFSIVNDDTLERPAFTKGGRVQQFNVVLANPPYSIKTWNRELFAHDKWGRNFLGVPPQSKADYAFIQHILASMDSENGRCAILLPHGVLNRLTEKDLRKNLIDADLVDAVISIGKNLFFNSPMEACILVCRTNKPKERKHRILLIKATDLVERKNTESYLTNEHINIISDIFLNYRCVEGRSTIIDINEIPDNKYSISPKLYVKSNNSTDTEDLSEVINNWAFTSAESNKELMSLINLLGNGNS
jgi:type I restriction enzyme M protein